MPPGEGQDQIDVVVDNELVDSFYKIEQADEIELGFPGCEAAFQLEPFCLIFIGDLNVMFVIDIDDMQLGFEEVEDRFDRINRNRVLYILEIGQQHDVFGGGGLGMGRNDDDRGDTSSDQIEGIATHQDLPEEG